MKWTRDPVPSHLGSVSVPVHIVSFPFSYSINWNRFGNVRHLIRSWSFEKINVRSPHSLQPSSFVCFVEKVNRPTDQPTTLNLFYESRSTTTDDQDVEEEKENPSLRGTDDLAWSWGITEQCYHVKSVNYCDCNCFLFPSWKMNVELAR